MIQYGVDLDLLHKKSASKCKLSGVSYNSSIDMIGPLEPIIILLVCHLTHILFSASGEVTKQYAASRSC